MRAPKLLCVASAVDLDFRYGCTPAWWQLWKGLHDEGVELIVMGTHGRSGLSRLLMGSVAEAVVRKATCPVLTLKQAAKAPLTKGKKRARAARS